MDPAETDDEGFTPRSDQDVKAMSAEEFSAYLRAALHHDRGEIDRRREALHNPPPDRTEGAVTATAYLTPTEQNDEA